MSTIKSSDEHLTLNADGSGNDIKFQSNGTEVASISDAGKITATNFAANADDLEIQSSTGEKMIKCVKDAQVNLYYDNSKKLQTTTTGVDVTGIMTDDRAFFSVASTNQNSGSSGANHKVEWKQSAILVDNKSGWDNSNYQWTVPSGHAGTYYIHCIVGMASMTTNQVKARLYKNNDLLLENHFDANNANTSFHAISLPLTTLVTLAVGDDIWATFYHADGTASSKDNSSSLVIMQVT